LYARVAALEDSFLSTSPDTLTLSEVVRDISTSISIDRDSMKKDEASGITSFDIKIPGSELSGKLFVDRDGARVEIPRQLPSNEKYYSSKLSISYSKKGDDQLIGTAVIQFSPRLDGLGDITDNAERIIGWAVTINDRDTILKQLCVSKTKDGMRIGWSEHTDDSRRSPGDMTGFRVVRDQVTNLGIQWK